MSSQHYGMGKKTLGGYLIGLFLSLIFTGVSFGVVIFKLASTHTIYLILTAMALLQLIAQLVFFLRMNTSKSGQWNLLPFLFTLIVVGILIAGSLWIMYHLDYNMMN